MNIHRMFIDSKSMIDFTDNEVIKYCGIAGHDIAYYLRCSKLTGKEAVEELKSIAKDRKFIVLYDYIKE